MWLTGVHGPVTPDGHKTRCKRSKKGKQQEADEPEPDEEKPLLSPTNALAFLSSLTSTSHAVNIVEVRRMGRLCGASVSEPTAAEGEAPLLNLSALRAAVLVS